MHIASLRRMLKEIGDWLFVCRIYGPKSNDDAHLATMQCKIDQGVWTGTKEQHGSQMINKVQ